MYYIVKHGEKINDIAKRYNCSLEELRKYNHHITDFQRVNPGMRLNIPIITEDVKNEIEDDIPFVEDYYQKEVKEVKEVKEIKQDLVEKERPDQMNQSINNDLNNKTNAQPKNTERPKVENNQQQQQDDRACYKYNYQYAGASPYPPRPYYPQPYPQPYYPQPYPQPQPVYIQPVYVQPYPQQYPQQYQQPYYTQPYNNQQQQQYQQVPNQNPIYNQ